MAKGSAESGTWTCTCGRQVPARFDECHCGMTRAHALALARADAPPPPRKPGTLGLALRAGAVGAVAMGAWGWYAAHTPASSAPVPESPPPMQAAASTPPPVAPTRPPETPPPYTGAGWGNWQPPPPNRVEAHEAVPAREEPPPPEAPPAAENGPSDMDRLRERTEMWRARYRPVAERIAQLEREIPQLEADVNRAGSVPYEDDNPSKNQQTRLGSDVARSRLAAARRELEQARRELSDIEEAARRDGVPSGQLY